MPEINFVKYQGIGNDFVLVDNRHQPDPVLTLPQAEQWCDRRYGIGADGVIFLLPGKAGTDGTMRIYNADGSEAEMCGNGIRCLAKFMAGLDIAPTAGKYRIHTLAGMMILELLPDGRVRVDMGAPRLLGAEIPTTLAAPQAKAIDVPLDVAGHTWQVTCVSMGNPHCIVFVEDLDTIDLAALGPQFEHHPVFPKRTNTEFVQVIQRDRLKMKVWERGVGATLACGTGACALVVAGVLGDRCDRTCTVELPGGCLDIEWALPQTGDGGAGEGTVYMTGAAERVFDGSAILP